MNEKRYTLTFDEAALSTVLAGLNELPAKQSFGLISGILQAMAQADREAEPKEGLKALPGDGC